MQRQKSLSINSRPKSTQGCHKYNSNTDQLFYSNSHQLSTIMKYAAIEPKEIEKQIQACIKKLKKLDRQILRLKNFVSVPDEKITDEHLEAQKKILRRESLRFWIATILEFLSKRHAGSTSRIQSIAKEKKIHLVENANSKVMAEVSRSVPGSKIKQTKPGILAEPRNAHLFSGDRKRYKRFHRD